MSSRLILLPKKSYTPWNASNVERVLRDERLERERLEKERQTEAEREEEGRIARIKQYGSSDLRDEHDTTSLTPSTPPAQHVNLFYKEEKELLLQQGAVTKADQQNGDTGSTGRSAALEQSKGVLPVRLGGDEVDRRANGQRFQWERNEDEQTEREHAKEERLKDAMDPMRMFCRTDKMSRRGHEDSMRMLSNLHPSSKSSTFDSTANYAASSPPVLTTGGVRHHTEEPPRQRRDEHDQTSDTKEDNKLELKESNCHIRTRHHNNVESSRIDNERDKGDDDSLDHRRRRRSRSSRRNRRKRRRSEDSSDSDDDDDGDKRQRKSRRHSQRRERRSVELEKNLHGDCAGRDCSRRRRR